MSVKRVKINEKVGISADFVTILEQCVGYRAECEKNARAFSGSSGKGNMTGCRGWQVFL